MSYKIWILLLITSVITLNCGENKIENINLSDAIFKAEGYNPNWKLEIDSKNGIHFYSNSEMNKIITLNSTKTKIMDVASTSFHGKTESAEIIVEIFRKQCINSKMHTETKYEVRVKAKRNKDNNYKPFKGCGEFIFDKRLNGKWDL